MTPSSAEIPAPKQQSSDRSSLSRLNREYRSQHGRSIADLSAESQVLVVFLRHSGCTFCREALDDVSKQREQIEAAGSRIVLVHMGDNEANRTLFESYGLGDVDRISDPSCELYRAYGLAKGSIRQLFGGDVFSRGFRAAILQRHGVGFPVGDVTQLAGVFLVEDNEIVTGFRHSNTASRPDYCEIAQSGTATENG